MKCQGCVMACLLLVLTLVSACVPEDQKNGPGSVVADDVAVDTPVADSLPEEIFADSGEEIAFDHSKCDPTEDLQWVPIPGGTFVMGCSPNDDECDDTEKPAHSVTLDSFSMLKTEVT